MKFCKIENIISKLRIFIYKIIIILALHTLHKIIIIISFLRYITTTLTI